MLRIDALTANPTRTLGVLALVLAAVGIAIGSGANFTATSANPANTFTAGSLTIGNSQATAILTAGNLKPGDVTTGEVDIENTGSISGTFSLSRSALTNTPTSPALSTQLDLVVKDCGNFSAGTPVCESGDTTKYTGTISAMTGSTALGTFAANEKHKYEFKVTFNSSADDTYQGGSATATFQWNAVQ